MAIFLLIVVLNPIPRWGGNNFFCKNRINLKLLDFLSYTYTHPIHLKNLKNFDYSSLDNHPKLTEIGKKGLKSGFWATKATVKQFFPFFL